MSPEPPKRTRPGSSSDLRNIVDEQPERLSINHPGVDGVAQPVPRKSTLVGMGVARPSGEFQPTMPAPRNPLRHDTIQRPPPPSTVAHARRTDPPPTLDPPPEENAPGSLSGDQTALLRDELARVRAQLAESEREKRVHIESKGPGPYQAPIVTHPPPAPPAVVVVEPKVAGMTMRQALIGLVLAMTALGAPLGIYLTAQAEATKAAVARQQVQITEAAKTSETAGDKTRDANKDLAATKAELARFKLYFIALQRRQGVAIRLPDGVREEDLPKLEFEAPLRKPGVVKPGATLIVQTPP